MSSRRIVNIGLVALAQLALTASAAIAQSAIAGVVKDTSGAVIPGVTVQASSPVLIEKTREAISDSQGLYKIVDLRPGVYTVTFTLQGFNTVKREAIELTAAFTATVSVEMRVGAVEESITVSAQAALVDVQNVIQNKEVTREVLDAIPTGTRSFQSVGVLIPGVTSTSPDVGGAGASNSSTSLVIHGSRANEQVLLLDGMPYNHGGGDGGPRTGYHTNDGSVQEISFVVGNFSADAENGGLRTNIIPKEGGDTFKGSFFTSYTGHGFESSNLTPELVAKGLTAVDSVKQVWDVNPAFGGPLMKGKLWAFGSWRNWGTNSYVGGMYFNKTPTSPFYTPDLDRQAVNELRLGSMNARLTWQVSPRNKINFFYDNQTNLASHWYTNRLASPEAVSYSNWKPNYLAQTVWRSTVTSRFLLEVGGLFYNFDWPTYRQPDTPPNAYSYTEQSTGLIWGAPAAIVGDNASHQFNTRVTASYVTGSHAFKAGASYLYGSSHVTQNINNGVTLQLLNGASRQVTQYALPLEFQEKLKANVGIYAQDQWTIEHLTINAGVRFDYRRAIVPAQHLPVGPFVAARDFAQVDDVPNWKDITPRVGVSYDLFGDGRTALKASYNKYLISPEIITFTRLANPVSASVVNATRTWTDSNGDFVPQCDFTNLAINGECGRISNTAFGGTNVTTRYDPQVIGGTGNRGTNTEISAGIQHQLLGNVTTSATYVRRWYGNLTTTDNLSVTSSDYSPYCVTAPVDSRLPGGGGNEICGFFDVNVNKFGQVNNLITFADNFGTMKETFSGVDLAANVRLPRGIIAAGGVSFGHTATDSCFVVDSPQALYNCKIEPPLQPNAKFYGVYPLPWWGIQTSATFQSIPGPQILANYTATNAQVRGSLGRDLASGVNGTVSIPLIKPGTLYADRLNQLDFRVSRRFTVSRTQLQASVDVFNALNGSAPIGINTTFGGAWQRPTQILLARFVKFGVRIEF